MSKIKTLVEFFDECQIDNVIGVLRYKPEKVIFVGYKKVMTNRRKIAIERLFEIKGLDVNIDYYIVGRTDYDSIVDKLKLIVHENDDCYFDATGGSELILAAMGAVSKSENIPVIQCDIRSGKYTSVYGDYALPDTDAPRMSIKEIITLNGGAVIENEPDDYAWKFDDDFVYYVEEMWDICSRNCSLWNRQSISFNTIEQFGHLDDLDVCANLTHMRNIKQGAFLETGIISDFIILDILKNFNISDDGILTFTYGSEQIRQCLTKAGNILEVYTYMLLNEIKEEEPEYYDDIDIGVYVDWDGEIHTEDERVYDTKNEIDIIVMRKSVPIFISCKNGEVKKEALYELETVANHFGGEYVKKVLLVTYISTDADSRRYILQRARDMKIEVIEDVDKLDRDEFISVLKNRIR